LFEEQAEKLKAIAVSFWGNVTKKKTLLLDPYPFLYWILLEKKVKVIKDGV
jgi:hypothetical protein